MKVPRPSGGSRQSTGVGKIFVKYDHADSARTALQALAGRKFADRTVVTTYFSEVSSRLLTVDLNSRLLANHVRGRKTSKSAPGRSSQWVFQIRRRAPNSDLPSVPFSVVVHPCPSWKNKGIRTPKNQVADFRLGGFSWFFLSAQKISCAISKPTVCVHFMHRREVKERWKFQSPLEKRLVCCFFKILFCDSQPHTSPRCSSS